MITEILRADHTIALRHAVDILNHGGLVAFPTDTVYGLAALPFNGDYVERLYVAKGRSNDRAIAVLLGNRSQISQVAQELSPEALKLAESFWPGPLTLIVPRLPSLPDVLSPQMTVGLRIPDHPFALALLNETGPLAVTSANLSGQANPLTAQDVVQQLNGRIHLVLDGGRTPGGVPSTVIDCTRPQLVISREGPITQEMIQSVLQKA